ncbi:MAG: o-succinylbenzoate synthase [Chloroflexi bacterium]|nr:o-succinylbenzoate synthase [Chloroflexota bacterium]MBK7178556.1 o-succinylbenzoate synthase [Chloroflexota bacterium]MBP6805636.1 o-succinylbenzoate synthase [Chloroflexota bacterium]MBP7593886.1 o-succinylbenzoate synthase [Chloroflexota bacterium]
MKLEHIDLYQIRMPLVSPFGTSFGMTTDRDAIIVKITAEGLTGWGECVASWEPGYSYETTQTAWHILRDFLVPEVLGKDLQEPADVQHWLRGVRGHPLAKAAIDQAAWDLTAQRDGLSVAQKLAQPYPEGPKERVKVGISIGTQPSVAATLDVIAENLAKGYGRIKLKIKPGHDIELARAARAAFPDTLIMLDANSAYRLEDAPLFRAMDDLNLLMIEQPLGHDDIYDHSQLRPLIHSPLCLDESITSADHARYAIALQACDIINVKPSRVSGWTEARQIHDLARAAGLGLWVGGMLETGIGRAAQLALAALPGFTLPSDISATERYYHQDIATRFTLNAADSTITVPTGPGLGIEVDEGALTAVTLHHQTIRYSPIYTNP